MTKEVETTFIPICLSDMVLKHASNCVLGSKRPTEWAVLLSGEETNMKEMQGCPEAAVVALGAGALILSHRLPSGSQHMSFSLQSTLGEGGCIYQQ